jgi:hypothetical protein
MAFSTTSFFAGVATVFAAVTIGFAGGSLITTAPKMEPNRLERVTAGNAPTNVAAATAATPAASSVPFGKAEASPVPPPAKNDAPETSAAPDRVVSMTPAPASQQVVPPQPSPVLAKEVMATDEVASQIDNAKRIREAELKKQARETERRAEQHRKKRQEIEAAGTAVKRMQRDGALQEASQQDQGPRLGFFGQD